ncbi:MAG TPA: hypothetical protein VIQ31_03275 [Phormidium sp.]
MNPFLTANLAAEKQLQAEVKQQQLTEKLQRLFDIGWEIGAYDQENKPISHEALQQDCKKLFDERNKLLEELLNNGQ